MKSLMRVTVLVAAAALVFGCVPEGDDDDGGGAGGMAGGGADEGPANEVNANIEGGAAAGPVSGSSEMSVPDQFHAAVFEGDLIVFLNSESGIIQFTVNTGEQQAPGSYTVIEDLGGQAHLTITSAGGDRKSVV